MKRCLIPVVLLVSLCVMLAGSKPAAAQQAGGKTFTFGLWDAMGKQSAQLNEFIKKIVTLVFSKSNNTVQFVNLTQDGIRKAVAAKKVDFTYLPVGDYVELVDAGREIHPVFSPGAKGHVRDNLCLIVKKDAAYTGLPGLAGKTAVLPSVLGDFIGQRYFLESKGMNKPIDKFFSKATIVPDEGGAISSVGDGKVDVAVVSERGFNFMRFANGSIAQKVKIAECSELPWPGSPVVWIGKPDPQVLKGMYDVMGHAESYPEFKQIKPILKLIQVQLNMVNEKDYDSAVRTYAAAKKKGWIAEFNRISGK